jgi:hypothetical protein
VVRRLRNGRAYHNIVLGASTNKAGDREPILSVRTSGGGIKLDHDAPNFPMHNRLKCDLKIKAGIQAKRQYPSINGLGTLIVALSMVGQALHELIGPNHTN